MNVQQSLPTGPQSINTAAAAFPRPRVTAEQLAAAQRVTMSEYRTGLADLVKSRTILTVTNRGDVTGYWLPATAIPGSAQTEDAQRQAQLQASIALNMLAQIVSPNDIATELAEIEAHRSAGGVIQ